MSAAPATAPMTLDEVASQTPPRRRELIIISADMLREHWRQIEPMLARACEYSMGQYSPAIIADGVCSGIYLALGVVVANKLSAILITEVRDTADRESIFYYVLVSGADFDEWLPLEPQIDEIARHFGCTKVRMHGRKGWLKRLQHYELLGNYVVMERRLS